MTLSPIDTQLLDTQQAFDSVAADYDGPAGNNRLIQLMREQLWHTVLGLCPPGSSLLDLGCGTGIDAAFFASRGYYVFATDWSPRMVERSKRRAEEEGLTDRLRVGCIGLQDLEQLNGLSFDLIYSDLGPLNCASDLSGVARACTRLLAARGRLVASVIGRTCPWEIAYYAVRGNWSRAWLRQAKESVPVNLNGNTVWTKYYAPLEFYSAFAGGLELTAYRALGLFMPPPYLIRFYERRERLLAPLRWLDAHLTTAPILRNLGDHFLMVLTKREKPVGDH